MKNCQICWLLKIARQVEDAEDYTPAELDALVETARKYIAKDIVSHHKDILAEIDRLREDA